jgi:hypothetical protein
MAACVSDPSQKPTHNTATRPREVGCASSHVTCTAGRMEAQGVRGSSTKGVVLLMGLPVNSTLRSGQFSQFFGQPFGFGEPLINFCWSCFLPRRALLGVGALGLASGPGPRERPTPHPHPQHQHTNAGLGRTGSSPPPGGRQLSSCSGSGAAYARDQGPGTRNQGPGRALLSGTAQRGARAAGEFFGRESSPRESRAE